MRQTIVPAANTAIPATTEVAGRVTARATQPIRPSALSDRGQRRWSADRVHAEALVTA